MLRKSTLNLDPGSQKWPNLVFLQKIEQLFLRPTRELIFSFKKLLLECTNRKKHPRKEKNHTLRKMTSNWPKIDFSDNEFWLLSENRIFRQRILKITITKVHCQKLDWKSRLMVCSFYIYDVYDRHNFLLNLRQKLRLFSDISFCMDIMMGMVTEDILTTFFGSTWSRAKKKVADTSTEKACQSK